MANDELNVILKYLAEQGEDVAQTVRDITKGTGLTSLAVRKTLAKSAKDSVPMVEIGKTENKLDGYKLTTYGMAAVNETPKAKPQKKAAKKPAPKQSKAPSKKVSSAAVTSERSNLQEIERKIAAYLVKEDKTKPVFKIAEDISENQDDVEKVLMKMDAEESLSSKLMADFNERVYMANESTKALAAASPASPQPKTPAGPTTDDIDSAVLSILSDGSEMAGKPLLNAVQSRLDGADKNIVESRLDTLTSSGSIESRTKGRGKAYFLPKSKEEAAAQPAPKKAAKRAAAPSVGKKATTKVAEQAQVPATTGESLSSDMSNLMGMLEESMNRDLPSAGPHAAEALEKVREYMTDLENEVKSWRKLASTFVSGAKGIVD